MMNLFWKWQRGWLAALAMCLLPEGASAASPVAVTIKTNYYAIKGTNALQIVYSLNQDNPWKGKGGFHGFTDWKVDWSFRTARGDNQVTLAAPAVRVQATIQLPQWTPLPGADPELVAQWRRYHQNLLAHELGHVHIARAAGEEILRQLNAVPAHATMTELTTAANTAGNQTLNTFRKKDADYDQQTRHGATQGAVFVATPRPTGRPSS